MNLILIAVISLGAIALVLAAILRTSRCLDNPHRQMRTLYVFHNT